MGRLPTRRIVTFRPRSQRRTAWIVLFALIFHVLWPSVVLASAITGGSDRVGDIWQQICSVEGASRFVKTPLLATDAYTDESDKSSLPGTHRSAAQHCPLCSGAGVLPTGDASPVRFDAHSFVTPLVREPVVPAVPPLQRGPAPRAPPRLS